MRCAIKHVIRRASRIKGHIKLNRIKTYKIYTIVLVVISLSIYALLWNSARDEIYYLCGNFSRGTEQASVIRQLNTAQWSNYKKINKDLGLAIVFSSKLHFSLYQCTINIDKYEAVTSAKFTSI